MTALERPIVRVASGESRAVADARLAPALAELEPFGERAESLRELARYAVGRDR